MNTSEDVEMGEYSDKRAIDDADSDHAAKAAKKAAKGL